ncbi:hypothetical protein ACFWS9_36310, partial [Streptomyces sp. NPDC058622]
GGDDAIRHGSATSPPVGALDNGAHGPGGFDNTPTGRAGDHGPAGHAPDNMPSNSADTPTGGHTDGPGGASHDTTPTGGHGSASETPNGSSSGTSHGDGLGHGDGPGHPTGGAGEGSALPDGPAGAGDDTLLPGGSAARPDGARYIEEPTAEHAQAARFYDEVRVNPDALDIRSVSENTGVSTQVLDRVRTHFFLTPHVMGEAPGVARQGYFTPRSDIAEMWQAASQRSLTPEEAVRFERYIAHEYVESSFIEAGIPYLRDEPHLWEAYANETESGYYHVWPENWADAGAHELATSERRGGFGHWGGLGLDAPGVELAPGLANIDEVVAALFQELRSKGIELK